jgi:hypothetical protein
VEPITLLIGSIHQPVVTIKRALRDALSKADYEYISGLEEFTRFVRLTGDRFWSEKDRCKPRREDTYCPLLLFAPDHPEYRRSWRALRGGTRRCRLLSKPIWAKFNFFSLVNFAFV